MDATITFVGIDQRFTRRYSSELYSWLQRSGDLRPFVRRGETAPRKGELGGWSDILVVALGSGGLGAILAQTLGTWLKTRKSDIQIEVELPDGTKVNISGHNLDKGAALLERAIAISEMQIESKRHDEVD